jgi:KUP system potassium uptake protein
MTANTGNTRLLGLTVGAVGVVYGDIGTSPLYAFRESLAAAAHDGGTLSSTMILGVLSLLIWTLLIVVTLKYITILMRADNQGEGGIISLMALAQQVLGKQSTWILSLGMLGAALFYGDAIITPAISILSALEGLKLVTHHFEPYIIPLSLLIMLVLFMNQRRGTAKVARFFGPITVIWFLSLAWGGILHIQDTPEVWKALNPYYALYFLTHHGLASLIALGAVFLAITGAEALYTDLGHFGKRPIRVAWLMLVMPSLILNYIGQAALVLTHPDLSENPFFLMYPDWALLPMVMLATIATIIASQAVITGAFSITHQAIQLGLLPRLRVMHTSADRIGQIYMPNVNWALFVGVVLLILMFRSSSNLAAAYGIAVTGTMVITSILCFVVMHYKWQWPMVVCILIIAPFVLIDTTFLTANLLKVADGGFMPILLSAALVLMMKTWVRGSRTLHEQTRDYHHTMEALIREINHYPPRRVEGTAIYLTSNPDYAPTALLQNLKHNHVLHKQNLIVTLRYAPTPHVKDTGRIEVSYFCEDFVKVVMHYGYMEQPNVTKGLMLLRDHGIEMDLMHTSFFISRRNIVPSANFGMPLWRDHIYIAMADLASDAADYFHIPRSRVVELGVQMTV